MTTDTLPQEPSTADAEKWLAPDIFIYDGHTYQVNPNFTVTQLNGNKFKSNGG